MIAARRHKTRLTHSRRRLPVDITVAPCKTTEASSLRLRLGSASWINGRGGGRSACAPVAQLDRALAYEARGRVFESPRAYHLFNNLPFPLPSQAPFGSISGVERVWMTRGPRFVSEGEQALSVGGRVTSPEAMCAVSLSASSSVSM